MSESTRAPSTAGTPGPREGFRGRRDHRDAHLLDTITQLRGNRAFRLRVEHGHGTTSTTVYIGRRSGRIDALTIT
jgi:hypothetical protein